MPGDALSVHPPKQSRSRRTLERIVQASLEILDAEGPEGLTVQAIVDRAGSSVGSFYARFAGKEELLAYLGERVWKEEAARWDAAFVSEGWEGSSLSATVHGAVRLLAEVVRSHTSSLKALQRVPGAREDAYVALHMHVIRGTERLLLERVGEMTHPAPATAVPLGLRAVFAVLEAAPMAEGDLPDLDGRVEEAARLLSAYLAGTDTGNSEGADVDFFDIWG